jgi:MFS superfamily sulfate permease-like transporter
MFKHIQKDFPASIIVFFVALPLCLGIALASGAPLMAGLIAGIVGGIVVGSLSGSPLGVSGPAAGLTVIVLDAITELGAFEAMLAAVVVAGVIQLILGFLKAGIIGYYFPSSVIKGMLSAIGIIIILKQIPHALGYDKDFEGDENFVQPDGENTFTELLNAFQHPSTGPIIITLVALAIMLLWERPFLKKFKFFQLVQGPIVAVLAGIFMVIGFQGTPYEVIQEHMVTLPKFDSAADLAGMLAFPDFSILNQSKFWVVAFSLALIASLETLLSVEAIDKLDPLKRNTPTNQELKAQGVGNIISGMLGGLPVTQVIVRSSANVQSGGMSKMSAVLHGFLLLFSVLLIPGILNMIPYAALAAVLLLVGYKLAKPSIFIKMYHLGWAQFLPFIVTIVAVVATDLLKGIAVGMVVAVFKILMNNYQNSYKLDERPRNGKPCYHITLSEETTFLNKGKLMKTLDEIPNNTSLVIDASKSFTIDYDVLEIIETFKTSAKSKGIDFELIPPPLEYNTADY